MAIKFGKKAGPIAGTLGKEEQLRRMAQQDDQQQPLDRIRGNQETDIYGMAADDSVFGEAVKDLTLKKPLPGEITQQVQDYADRLNRDQDQPGEPADGGAPPPAEEEPQGLFEDVTDIDARQERERQAFADELAARKAEQQQQAEARAGLGGMGLSGATAELVGDVGRQAERAGDIAMADLGRRQQQETFDELRRQASIWTFEEEFNVDLDGDGNYGAPPEEEPVIEGEEGDATAAPTRRKGSASNPIKVKNRESLPETAEAAKDETGDFMFTEDGERLFVDEDGKYYVAGRGR